MEDNQKPFIYFVLCKYLRQVQSLFRNCKINLLIILAVMLFVLFCFFVTNVKATDEGGGGGSMGGRDDELLVSYDYYDSKGHKTGDVLLTQDMYDAEHWVLFADENNNIYYCSNSSGDFSIELYNSNTYSTFAFSNSASRAPWRDVLGLRFYKYDNYYVYNRSTQTFTAKSYDTSKPFSVSDGYWFNPSAVIKRKNMQVYFIENGIYPYNFYNGVVDFPELAFFDDFVGGSDNIYIKLNSCFPYGLVEGTLSSDTVVTKETFSLSKLIVSFIDVASDTLVYYNNFSNISLEHPMFQEVEGSYYIVIPRADLTKDFVLGQDYKLLFDYDFSVKTQLDNNPKSIFTRRFVNMDTYSFTYEVTLNPDNPDDPNKPFIDAQTGTTNAIKEQTEVNKNIFEKIGEMLSYINPFSENFFVYKLIELLIEMIKSLFIPSNDFFNNFFTELNNWFGDRFGFLYYPLELFFDLCNRFLNIDFSEPIINIPDIVEPTTNLVLIHSTQYNFNSLLENDILKTVHDIYFIIVDAIIYIGLALLLYDKYEEVMTK